MIDRHRFQRLLHPASIAVVGGRAAEAAIRECKRFGYTGEIWPVNPTRSEMSGLHCYASIDDLPGVPDAAFLAVNADLTLAAVDRLSKLGCGGVVCYAAGFKESGGDGVAKQQALLELAGEMPIIGPNCYGVLNALEGVALWPDQHGCQRVESGVAIITQSGNIGLNMTMQRRGLPLAAMIAVGNQAQLGLDDCIDMLLDDDRITAIGLHIEGIGNLENFDRVARRALDMQVPIVALKTGRSITGAKIALSHTSSLAGEDRLYDALFDRLGIARVDTVTAFLETLKFLSAAGPLKGNRLASMSCSGGEASLMADLFEGRSVHFPVMGDDHKQAVQDTLSDLVAVSNPLDYHTFIWGNEERLTATFAAMMSGGYDATILVLDWPSDTEADWGNWDASLKALVRAARETGQKAVVVSSMFECQPDYVAGELLSNGVVPMIGMEDCADALEAAYKIGNSYTKPVPEQLSTPETFAGKPEVWNEVRSKKALEAYGLVVPKCTVVKTAEQAVSVAETMGFPVVVKAIGEHLSHKSEVGGVHLNLESTEEIEGAIAQLSAVSDSFLVEQMVPEPVAEVIIGVTRDKQFGPTLLVGAGGILVELLKDSVPLLLPTTREAVEEAISRLRIATLLGGYRGKPAGDVPALVDAVMAVSEFVSDHVDRLYELDVNPLLIMPRGEGVIAVDALVRMTEAKE